MSGEVLFLLFDHAFDIGPLWSYSNSSATMLGPSHVNRMLGALNILKLDVG